MLPKSAWQISKMIPFILSLPAVALKDTLILGSMFNSDYSVSSSTVVDFLLETFRPVTFFVLASISPLRLLLSLYMRALRFCVHFMSRIIQFIDRITENLRDGSDGITSTSRTKSPEKASSESSDSSERPESVKKYQAQIKYLRKMSLQKDDEILRLQNEIDSQNDLMSQTFTYSDEDADDSRTPEDLLRSLTTLSKFMQTERTAAFSKIESTDTPDWQTFSADEMKTLQGLLRQISCSRRTIECLETATKFPEIQDVEVLEESESTRGFEDYSTEFGPVTRSLAQKNSIRV